MADESEVWEEIRDALHQLVEQGERQTALLEKMVEQGIERGVVGRQAVIGTVIMGLIAMCGWFITLVIAYGVVGDMSPVTWVILSIPPQLLLLLLVMAVGYPELFGPFARRVVAFQDRLGMALLRWWRRR